jgi:hypothetical protein
VCIDGRSVGASKHVALRNDAFRAYAAVVDNVIAPPRAAPNKDRRPVVYGVSVPRRRTFAMLPERARNPIRPRLNGASRVHVLFPGTNPRRARDRPSAWRLEDEGFACRRGRIVEEWE